jgi:hypothetical protein
MGFFSNLDLELQCKYANHIGYTDVNPYEVIRVVTSRTIEIREMDAIQTDEVKPTFVIGGFSAHSDNAQSWDIKPNESNPVFRIRLHSDGRWKDKWGHKYNLADAPRKFYDYNF